MGAMQFAANSSAACNLQKAAKLKQAFAKFFGNDK